MLVENHLHADHARLEAGARMVFDQRLAGLESLPAMGAGDGAESFVHGGEFDRQVGRAVSEKARAHRGRRSVDLRGSDLRIALLQPFSKH